MITYGMMSRAMILLNHWVNDSGTFEYDTWIGGGTLIRTLRDAPDKTVVDLDVVVSTPDFGPVCAILQARGWKRFDGSPMPTMRLEGQSGQGHLRRFPLVEVAAYPGAGREHLLAHLSTYDIRACSLVLGRVDNEPTLIEGYPGALADVYAGRVHIERPTADTPKRVRKYRALFSLPDRETV